MDTDIRISVLTPVYNRADKIHRVFDSLERSTFKNFELIIMDDGSTDNIEDVVKQYKEKVFYPVTFIRKENGGKHTALNILHQMPKGEYVFQLDSDDEITPDAMEKALKLWDSIDPARRDEYWCVVGRVVDQNKGEMHGTLFPEGINDLDWTDIQKIMRATPGEKWALQRADVLKKYKFPEPKGISFVTESILWSLIQKDYKEYLTNEVFRIYYVDDGDCLSAPTKSRQWAKNTYNNRIYTLNRGNIYQFSFIDYWKQIAHFGICHLLLSRKDRAELEKPSLKNKLAMCFLLPPIYIVMPMIKKKIGWIEK